MRICAFHQPPPSMRYSTSRTPCCAPEALPVMVWRPAASIGSCPCCTGSLARMLGDFSNTSGTVRVDMGGTHSTGCP